MALEFNVFNRFQALNVLKNTNKISKTLAAYTPKFVNGSGHKKMQIYQSLIG